MSKQLVTLMTMIHNWQKLFGCCASCRSATRENQSRLSSCTLSWWVLAHFKILFSSISGFCPKPILNIPGRTSTISTDAITFTGYSLRAVSRYPPYGLARLYTCRTRTQHQLGADFDVGDGFWHGDTCTEVTLEPACDVSLPNGSDAFGPHWKRP